MSEWAQVTCDHAGRGVDAEPEVMYVLYLGDDPKEVLRQWARLAPTSRMVYKGRLADSPGEYRRARHESDVYAHRQLACVACGRTERVSVPRMNEILERAATNGAACLDVTTLLRVM